jgi:hypothetical protein
MIPIGDNGSMLRFRVRLQNWLRNGLSVIASGDPLVLLPLQIYGPFLAVGLFMIVHDDCSHCQKAFFEYFLILPGIMMSAVLSRVAGLSFAPNTDPVYAGVSVVLTFALVVFLSRFLPESMRKAFGWLIVVPVFFLEAILCRALIAM